jgi:hypothetical protein
VATYSVAAGALAVHDKTLAANVTDSVSFAQDPQAVEVLTDGAAKMYVTVDGSEPTVSGANTYLLLALPGARRITHPSDGSPVKLRSAGTPTYSVTGV